MPALHSSRLCLLQNPLLEQAITVLLQSENRGQFFGLVTLGFVIGARKCHDGSLE
jgi:hypothetical protein